MKQLSIFFILLFLIFFGLHSNAQPVDHYSTSDGLAHQHVKSLFQDSRGYIWAGTWDGISKFDGNRFSIFRHNSEDSTTIFGNETQQFTEDSFGNVWAMTMKGLMRYSENENKFERVFLRPGVDNFSNISFGNVLCFDIHGKGWIADNLGLISFDINLENIRYIDIDALHSFEDEYQLALVPDGTGLWMASSQGLFHFNYDYLKGADQLELWAADSSFHFRHEITAPRPLNFVKASTGDFVLRFLSNQIYISDKTTGTLQRVFPPPVDGVKGNYQDLDIECEIAPGELAFSTLNYGILILDLEKKQFIFDHPFQLYLRHQTIYSVLLDQQHNIWAGGLQGLYKYTEPQLNFDAWLCDPGDENAIHGNSLMTMYVDGDYLWAGTKGGGVDRVDLKTMQVDQIHIPESFSRMKLSANGYCIFGLDENNLLVNKDSALLIYDIPSGDFSFVGIFKYHIYKMIRDEQSDIWISDDGSLYLMNFRDALSPLLKSVNINAHCRDICQTGESEFFLASDDGLCRFDKTDFVIRDTYIPPGNASIPEVCCIYQTPDGLLWVGSLRNGISCFDPKTEKFIKHFDTDDGLIDNSVNVIFEDDSGSLWMSTWKGISRFDPNTESFTNYSTASGLPFPEFNTGAYFKDEGGNLYFGGVGGVIRFNPESFVNFDLDFTPKINSVIGNNKEIKMNYPLADGEMLIVPSDQNSINIYFTAFDYRNPDLRIYRYRLNGLENDWSLGDRSDFHAHYSSLTSGMYVFELQSTYKDWPWNSDSQKVIIKVNAPPIFERKNFQILLLVILGLLSVAVVFLRIRNKNMRREILITKLEKDVSHARLNFLKSQMNPHFYFNTLNSINSFILKNDIRSANKFLTTFARLMREILENSQKEFVTIAEEIEMLGKYLTLQQLRFPNIFDFVLVAEDQVKNKKIPPMLLQPFVENSIEYAFTYRPLRGMLSISFEMVNGEIICIVKDDGIGIKRSQELKNRRNRKSTAIQNIYDRMEMLNGIYNIDIRLNISNTNPENQEFPGTLNRLVIPDFDKVIPE